MRTIATLQAPDTGTITFGDIDVLHDRMALRKVLGYLPQEFGVYPKVSADRLLNSLAELKGIGNPTERRQIVGHVLEITNLTQYRHRNVSDYSGGMKQRFGIAQLLLNDPQLIIVDEPTAGLDPAERHRFLNVLRAIGSDHIVIFSTHIVDDVKDLCTDMAIMNEGRILYQQPPYEALEPLQGKIWTTNVEEAEAEAIQQGLAVVSTGFAQANQVSLRVLSDAAPGPDFKAAEPKLDDVYFIHLKGMEMPVATAG